MVLIGYSGAGGKLIRIHEFPKKFEMTLMLFLGDWGKKIHEKNLKKKSPDTVPLRLQSKLCSSLMGLHSSRVSLLRYKVSRHFIRVSFTAIG